MGRFRKIIEDTINKVDNPFIIRLISTCGTTNNLLEGGLILPDGQLIRVFTESTISYYDLVSKVYSAVSSLNDNEDLIEQFDIDLIDNSIIKYSIGHDFQPNFITLPSIQITDVQKQILQQILNILPEDKDISVMTEEDLLQEVTAVKGSSIEKVLDTLLSKQLDEGEQKVFDKDSGYNVSEDELVIFDKLKEKYPNIKMSVTDDRFINPETHRHFQIDFYDPDTDTAFNLNKHIKHGRRKYDAADPNCQADVKWLQNKDGEFYAKILHTWRDLDPLKREVAKQNGLKFIEWFNMDEFNRWYENPSLTYEEYKYAPDSMQYDRDEYFAQKARGRDIYGLDSEDSKD